MYRLAVVDDNDAWCFVLAHLLRQHGYEVSTFTDAQAFLREANQFDLALIDFSMPARQYQLETDGPDVIRKLNQRLHHPPILVLISAFFTEDILKQGTELCPEADAYLSKQIEAAELVQRIEQLLADRSPNHNHESQHQRSSYSRSHKS